MDALGKIAERHVVLSAKGGQEACWAHAFMYHLMGYIARGREGKMTHATALTICPTSRYNPSMSKGRKPIGPVGPHPNCLLKLRLACGLTQAGLGSAIGVKGPYIGRMEKGEIKITEEQLQKLCVALNAKPWEIVPERFGLSQDDLNALRINQILSEKDPARRARWIEDGEDLLRLVNIAERDSIPPKGTSDGDPA